MPARAADVASSISGSPARAEDMFAIVTLGELLDDLQKIRVATGQRIAALERETGGRFPQLDALAAELADAEHKAHLELVRTWRKHPLAPWAAAYFGLGEKSIARLIALIGDPAERPNVDKLRAYCGHGNPHLKRTKGMSQEQAMALGNPRAKTQVWLISVSMLKSGNRAYYDQRRARTADRDDWTDGHKHADALRYQGKMFLRDLWVAANNIRAGHTTADAQSGIARADESEAAA